MCPLQRVLCSIPEETLGAKSDAAKPPSFIIKNFFNELKEKEPSDEELKAVACQCLLPANEVSLWLEHLKTVHRNRKHGAARAAQSRSARSQKHQHLQNVTLNALEKRSTTVASVGAYMEMGRVNTGLVVMGVWGGSMVSVYLLHQRMSQKSSFVKNVIHCSNF